jgi:type VI protein secretion system component VasF
MYEGHTISVLSGGRKRRRRHHMLALPLWLATGAFASFAAAALVLIRI